MSDFKGNFFDSEVSRGRIPVGGLVVGSIELSFELIGQDLTGTQMDLPSNPTPEQLEILQKYRRFSRRVVMGQTDTDDRTITSTKQRSFRRNL